MNTKFTTRRNFTQFGLGLITAAVLTACGGGGSSDGDTSSKVNLRKAFDEIQLGMSKDEVRAIVGRHEDDESSFNWTEGNEILRVFTDRYDDGVSRAVRVNWQSGYTQLERNLAMGE